MQVSTSFSYLELLDNSDYLDFQILILVEYEGELFVAQ